MQTIQDLYAQARQEAGSVSPGDRLLQTLDQINADAAEDLLAALSRDSLEKLSGLLRRKAEEAEEQEE